MHFIPIISYIVSQILFLTDDTFESQVNCRVDDFWFVLKDSFSIKFGIRTVFRKGGRGQGKKLTDKKVPLYKLFFFLCRRGTETNTYQ